MALPVCTARTIDAGPELEWVPNSQVNPFLTLLCIKKERDGLLSAYFSRWCEKEH